MRWAAEMEGRMEVALAVVFLVGELVVSEFRGWIGGERGGYSSEALPKTVDTPRMRIAGW
jgi:hypothetical protein